MVDDEGRDVIETLEAIEKNLELTALRLTALDLHIQMIDRNIEQLVQLLVRTKE